MDNEYDDIEDPLFDDIEEADLELHGEEAPEKDTPLGRSHTSDMGDELYDPADKYDAAEERSRGRDFENTPGRTRTGKEGELDLSRVNLDAGGRASGGGDGADWEGNFAGKGMTAVDGTGFVSDTRGGASMTGRHEDVDEDLHQEMRESGLRLGMNSVNTLGAGFALANARYMAGKLRWQSYNDDYKKYLYAKRKADRANRGFDKVRADSVHRVYLKHYNKFIEDRTAADPYWEFMSDEEIGRMDGIDSRSARQLAEKWRMDTDEKALQAFVIKYTALVNDVQVQSIRARFRRKPHEQDLAEHVFVTDMLACGCLSSGGFNKKQLLASYGDELVEMSTPASEEERRSFIIEGTHELFKVGALYPPYTWAPLEETLGKIIGLLEEGGVDLLPPEEEIDWSRV